MAIGEAVEGELFFANKSASAKDNFVRQAVWLNGEQRNEKDMLGVRNDCSSSVG